MENKNALAALSALAQESRLAVFRLLIEAGPGGMSPGQIGERLGIAPSSLSFHLKELSHAGLIAPTQGGRYLIIHFKKMPMKNVLFLCTATRAARFWPKRPSTIWPRPTGEVHPRSLALLAREGIASAGYHSKSWDTLPVVPDIVITVCGSAAGGTCPAYLGPVLRAYWGVDHPAHASGTDAQIDASFMQAYATLRARIEALFALPAATLDGAPDTLKHELDRIGTLHG